MTALSSIGPAIRGVVRNPILLVAAGLVALVQFPQLIVPDQAPILASIVSLGMTGLLIFLMPFYQGGIIGMADEALTDRTGLGTFVQSGTANYVSLLVAYLVLFAVNFAFGMLIFVAVLVGAVSIVVGEGDPSVAALAALAIVGLLVVLAYVLVTFFVQFYAHAIVLSDRDVVEGFKTSVGLVRSNLLSTLGYTIVLAIGGGIVGGGGVAASFLLTPEQASGLSSPELSLPVLVAAGVAYVVAIAIVGAFYATYSVAFYRSISSEERRPPSATDH